MGSRFVSAEEAFLDGESGYARLGYILETEHQMASLDKEEKELLDSFEQNEWKPVANQEAEAKRYREYARATFKKDMRVNIRISKKDLDALQTRALQEGIPYQTLIGSVLHKYVDGRLVEKARR